MDELVIEGKSYISSKRAAALTGYAKDYVGQLCREGRVEARLVGRSWYVFEPSILAHRFPESEAGEKREVEEDIIIKKVEEVSEITNNQAVETPIVYEPEEQKDLPELAPKEGEESQEESLSEMQSAWQDWFKEGASREEVVKEKIDAGESSQDIVEEQPVELHRVKSARPMEIPKPVMKPARADGIIIRERVRRAGKLTQGQNLVIRALLIAAMVIAITIALIGSGITERLSGTNQQNFGIFNYLGGASIIK